MTIKQKIGAALAMGSLAASILMPASAFAAVKIKGNGKNSTNGVAVVSVNGKFVGQRSSTTANTFVGNLSNTGVNRANGNTGGNNDKVEVKTGDTTTTSTVRVTGGDNTNTGGEGCCCDRGDTDAEISGNGANSTNGILIVDVCVDVVLQSNTTTANTAVISVSNTGGNTANGNTGGDVTIDTGNSTTTSTVTVTGGSNSN